MFMFTHPSDFESRRSSRMSGLAFGVIALATLVGAGTALQAQATQKPSTLQTPAISTSDDALFSSSAAEDAPATTTEASVVPMTPKFAELMQYGGGQRQRYGRPRYRGSNTNADGSSKYIFYGGAGFTQPLGNTWHYLTPGYGLQIGGGRQFNHHFAVPIEFDFDHFSFSKQALANQGEVYFADPVASDNGLDGSSHIWSFSVDPTYNLFGGDDHGGWGSYVVAGVGFYHKVADFTIPEEEEYCDPFYGICEPIEIQGTFDQYVSNAPGFSGGFGVTYKFSRFSNERLYGEVRYVFIDNSQRQGFTAADAEANDAYTGNNFYPANSNRTTYIPVKFGIRF